MDLKKALKNYFDLNERERTFYDNIISKAPDHTHQALETVKAAALNASGEWSLPQQIIMYLGIFVGVLCSAWVTSAVSGKQIEITSASLASLTPISGVAIVSYFGISALIALLIVPIVYGKLDPNSPGLVKFAVFFQSGVAWPILLDGVVIIKNSAGI